MFASLVVSVWFDLKTLSENLIVSSYHSKRHKVCKISSYSYFFFY